MSSRTIEAIITGAVGLVAVIVVRWSLGVAFARYERRLAHRDPAEAARKRTTLAFLRRVIVALVFSVAVWSVLSLYPQTDRIVNALLASSAVLALVVGLAFNVPLSNLGSGLLVAFAQPLRLGDRVTIADETGFVEEISLLYTTLVTDEARRVYIPNTQLTTSAIVNRTIRDPRRVVSAAFPCAWVTQSTTRAKSCCAPSSASRASQHDETRVLVGEVKEGAVWLTATVSAPLDADVIQLGSDLREEVLDALGEAGALAA